jgi:hypothetical protein
MCCPVRHEAVVSPEGLDLATLRWAIGTHTASVSVHPYPYNPAAKGYGLGYGP